MCTYGQQAGRRRGLCQCLLVTQLRGYSGTHQSQLCQCNAMIGSSHIQVVSGAGPSTQMYPDACVWWTQLMFRHS
jgi:hypothetical protein